MKKIIFFFLLVSLTLISCEPKPGHETTADIIKNAVTDIDGNNYDAVKIGNQIWMASNLKTTHFPSGDTIYIPSEMHPENAFRMPPAGDINNVDEFGYLYSYRAATRVCPDGWHLPSRQEWYDLEETIINTPEYLEKSTSVAKALASEKHWIHVSDFGTPGFQTSTNNATGFSALPADMYAGYVSSLGSMAAFWTIDILNDEKAVGVFLGVQKTGLSDNRYGYDYALSVRCVKD